MLCYGCCLDIWGGIDFPNISVIPSIADLKKYSNKGLTEWAEYQEF